jgi:hypothetical protein
MANKLRDPFRHKFSKAKYRTINNREYDQALKNRGSLTIWFSNDIVTTWNDHPKLKKKRGGQIKYSDLAIETCITLSLIYKQRLRQNEGYVESLIKLMNLDLDTPDYTTISRRSKDLKIKPLAGLAKDKNLVVAIDSTGVKIYGEKEWQEEKYKNTKTRKSWRKLHIAVDVEGFIVASSLTNHDVSDCAQVPVLLEQIETPIDSVLADGAYDQIVTYKAMEAHQEKHGNGLAIKAYIPPNLGFRPENPNDSKLRIDNIKMLEQSRHLWQKKTEYGRRAKAENTMFRYKTIIGNKLKARSTENQKVESNVAVNILNRMTKLGMPRSKKIA